MPSESVTASEEEVVWSMKLQNSDVLSNLDVKLSHILEKKRGVIKELVEEFSDLFPDVPGRTVAASHDVYVSTARSVKQHPYQMNPTKLEALRQEVEYMLCNGIIEQIHSQWNSPYAVNDKSFTVRKVSWFSWIFRKPRKFSLLNFCSAESC